MKRYFMRLGEDYNGTYSTMEEDTIGDWVKYEDVEELLTLLDDFINARFTSYDSWSDRVKELLKK